jgi:hypothetical protein
MRFENFFRVTSSAYEKFDTFLGFYGASFSWYAILDGFYVFFWSGDEAVFLRLGYIAGFFLKNLFSFSKLSREKERQKRNENDCSDSSILLTCLKTSQQPGVFWAFVFVCRRHGVACFCLRSVEKQTDAARDR